MHKVKEGSTVKVHYTGKLKDGSVFDSSEGRDPLAFTMGAGMMIPGFENGVMGMTLNEEKSVTIQPKDAYGEVREDMIAQVEKKLLPKEIDPKIGMELMSQTPDGQQLIVKIIEVKEDAILVDANHALAGKELTFDIKVVEITDPK
ncbi:MAG: peptidylprolyl isomerase [Bacteroidales bacterium]|nr:peptidylprolyl isomerase [Bacteroidales bacterium]MCF8404753.1 peptidylprolyl isomerase [Bacteroidales bacterium]